MLILLTMLTIKNKLRRIGNFIIAVLVAIVFVNQAYSEENKGIQLSDYTIKTEEIASVYKKPYSFWENDINYSQMGKNVSLVLGASVVGVGILYLMPESVTNWDKSDIKPSTLFGDWWDNVSSGPVVDKDDWFLNWITHPYWGAVYYMSARSAGANAPYSFLFSVIASTFFWEYGVEAFAEVPSIQDLFITPIVGSIIGEGFYASKRHILNNDYRLLGSKAFGHVVVFLMDPLSELGNWLLKDYEKKNELVLSSFPGVTRNGHLSYNMKLSFKF